MTRLLAELIARRRQIVDMIAAENQRAGRMIDHRLTRSIARLRNALEKELAELDRLIDELRLVPAETIAAFCETNPIGTRASGGRPGILSGSAG